ncbi:sialidase family protein [Novipirellula artificiosorum]|uniref:BNR/Asp-box repeat protein n=1 Tax=Novipirellula artificiosorum TaxID=2528016 RepID=A0A5C6E4Y0_9BACT|nr:sialidase family protein [Novipirellula artificiosorum]TWU42641.1 BNR/Asp-box repeat protein [Novipirellula artificiosorum]
MNGYIPWAGIHRNAHWKNGEANDAAAIRVHEDGSFEVLPGYHFYKQVSTAGQPGMKVATTIAVNRFIYIIAFESNGTSVTVVSKRSDRVLMTSGDSVYVSRDSARSFQKISSTGLPQGKTLHQITASPVSPDSLLLWADGGKYDWPRYFSHDEGRAWHQVQLDSSDAFLPYNPRKTLFAWHPTDASVAFSFGGDWINRSTNRGERFAWHANGYTGILVGDSFNFNVHHPELLFVGSQDYNGAVSDDGGDTWRYTNVSGQRWGGHSYGAYALSPDVLAVGSTSRWHGPRTLALSRDGGETWLHTQQQLVGPAVACGDPRRPEVAFVSNLRSEDGGRSWLAMNDCDAVFTASAGSDGTLHGVKGERTVVTSADSGRTWQTLAEAPGRIVDLAVDHLRSRVYAATSRQLVVWDGKSWSTFTNLPKDQQCTVGIRSVAVDPIDPAILYAVSRRNTFLSNAAVIRSVDAGQNWEVLTRRTPLDLQPRDGGCEGVWVRVHPRTREAWVAGTCFGIWKWKRGVSF